MIKVVFNIVRNGALLVYPDNLDYFYNTEVDYDLGVVVADYDGALALTEYVQPIVVDNRPELLLTNVTGADSVDVNYTFIEVDENTPVTLTGTLSIPDTNGFIYIPWIRKDTGRTIFAKTSVTSGIFSSLVQFNTSGMWETSGELINSFREPQYHIQFVGVMAQVAS